MEPIRFLVVRAQAGDIEAFGELVRSTQATAYAVARGILHNPSTAEDAMQQAYLRAFRRLSDLEDPAAFPSWLRRIVVTVALNLRRSRRVTLVQLDDLPEVPVLDEAESYWSESQRKRLAAALLMLSPEDRQICNRRYYGRWSTARLAAAAGVDDAAMRKRLQRIRDRLRKEIEMAEQRDIPPGELRPDFPEHLVELLARPQLTELPENPVGRILHELRSVFSDFTEYVVPEIVDLVEARKTIANDAIYLDPVELHRIDDRRILRYDLTLPFLLSVRDTGEPLRAWVAGKAYRLCQVDATHLEAFHQAEAFWIDERARLDPWHMTGRVLQSMDRVLPERAVKIVPTVYPMCKQAWELEIEDDGHWFEMLAWGIFTDKIVSHLGLDPNRYIAVGVGYGLERLAMLRYHIDDIRKIEMASVA
jgi:RNA polymerase sigma-70 factor (ECF subfamily)